MTAYNWQSADQVGREAIADAIEAAESRLLAELGYAVAPHYASATLPYPRYFDPLVSRTAPLDATGRWLSVTLPEGKIQALGIERLSSIQTNVALTFSDTDGDGLNDTFTLATAGTTTETDPNNIAVYFNATDRWDGSGAGDEWRILPVTVTINANGTVSVRGRYWQVVKPVLYEGVGSQGVFAPIDPTNAANFASSLDVYRRYPFTEGAGPDTSQAEIIWETEPYLAWAYCCVCGTASAPSLFGAATDPASYWGAVARCGFRDTELGEVLPGVAVYDSATAAWQSVAWGQCRQPDRVIVRYLAGEALVNQEMNKKLQMAVARFACAEMPSRISACDASNRTLYRWQFDHARAAGANDEQYRISENDLDNPFGTRSGQVYAWRVVKELRQLRGVGI